jgi:transcriptional repressor of cell division inhibition gene dicB
MKTAEAIKHAGSVKALAELLEITSSAVSQWGEDVPEHRMWQLRVLRPAWFNAQLASNEPWDGTERRAQS